MNDNKVILFGAFFVLTIFFIFVRVSNAEISVPLPDYVQLEAAMPENLPCISGADNRRSDLCAQWKAADASRLAALASVYSVGLGFLTLLAAVVAAIYAGSSAKSARTSLAQSIEFHKALIRPHMVVKRYIWDVTPNGLYRFGCEWSNVGSTSTRGMRTSTNHILTETPLEEGHRFERQPGEGRPGHAGPHCEPFMSPLSPNGHEGITKNDLDAVMDGRLFLYVFGWARYYENVEGSPERSTKFCVCPKVARREYGGRPDAFLFEIFGEHNAAD